MSLPENATQASWWTQGVEKMQLLERDRVYWQGMDADNAEYVKHC